MDSVSNCSRSGPLCGVRILEFSSYFTGPFASALLADYGGDVIKVEPSGGDTMRQLGTRRGNQSASFETMNRSKRSVQLDLKDPNSKTAMIKLVRWSEVLIQNYRPSVAKKLGIDYEACSAINPDIIHVSISGYGEVGPYAKMPTYDPIVQGHTGIAYAQGVDEEPVFVKQALVDKITGMYASHGILAALFARERGQGGQSLTINMYDSALAFQWPDGMNEHTFVDGDIVFGSTMASMYNTLQTKDGYITVSPITNEQFYGYCRALELEEFIGDSRVDSLAKRAEPGAKDVARALGARLREFTTKDICARLIAEDVPHGPVLRRNEVMQDVQARYAKVHEFGPEGRRNRMVASPVEFGKTPLSTPTVAPLLGEDTDAVLTGLADIYND